MFNVNSKALITIIKNGLIIDDFTIKDTNYKDKKITLLLNRLSNYIRVKNRLQKKRNQFLYIYTKFH